MSSKGERNEDNQQLIIDDPSVYRITTRDVDPMEEELNAGLLNRRGFEHRGIITVIISTLIASVLLLSIAFIQVNLNSTSIFTESNQNPFQTTRTRITYFPKPGESLNSTWATNYILPPEIPLFEIHTDDFNFNSSCPSEEEFALVITGSTKLSSVESWMKRCGGRALYFRMNSDTLEKSDANRIVTYVNKNAHYIPVRAEYHGVKDSYDLLSNSSFLDGVDKESNIITFLTLSGWVTAGNVRTFVDLVPYVEELRLDGPELCGSLVRGIGVSQSDCQVSWGELTSLKINFGGGGSSDCLKTFEYIDMCWAMQKLNKLEVKGTNLNPKNVRYIEDVIDKYRIMNVTFEHNVCTEEVLKTPTAYYMCSVFR